MKLLLFADLQATDGSERCFLDPSLSLQQWRVTRFLEVLREVYTAHQCEGLIDLGDTTDDRSSIPVPTIDTLLGGLADFEGWNVKIIGNHEQFFRDARLHVGRLFERTFTVLGEPAIVEPEFTDDVYVFASYPGDYGKLIAWLKGLPHRYQGRPLVLFGHFSVIGSKMTGGLAIEGVPKGVLAPFQAGLLGHIHKPQAVTKTVHYLGSPFQQNWGESGEHKRLAIFDTQTRAITWVPLAPYGFPLYRTLTCADFCAQADPESEDRYKVILRTPEDMERLFGHPLSGRAEPVYEFTAGPSSVDNEVVQPWTFRAILERWMARHPPEKLGITLPSSEMLEIGLAVASGET